ncbi:TPA: ead/Ea22-like family protein [Escherichia coli]|nr:ead/Ea22-like family protein [Escherichia coli]
MSKIDYQALREAAVAIETVATPQKLLAFRMKVTPQVVLALLDELEAKDKAWSAQDNHINQQAYRIESLEKKNGELGRSLEAAEKRIAELSASHRKLRNTMAGIHNTIRMDGGYTPLAAILNAAKRAYEESASAAGIRIKGE